jgi:hypothetical protein
MRLVYQKIGAIWLATLATLGLLTGLAGCGDTSPIFPIEPKLTFLDLAPDTVTGTLGIGDTGAALVLRVGYTDGDGDLGAANEQDTNQINFFLQDLRPEVPIIQITQAGDTIVLYDGLIRATLPNLTAEARNPSIQGVITYTFPSVLPNLKLDGSLDSARFRVWVVDRAGNQSNRIETSKVYIR